MNLKKLFAPILVVLCISVSMPIIASPLRPTMESGTTPSEIPKTTNERLLRLQEIKSMNIKNLSRPEKKDLRKEVKQIRKELKASQNGIYLSIGAVIIIVLLLLLLL